MPQVYPANHIIDRFKISLKDGSQLTGVLSQTARATGRRIKVLAGPHEVFDTNDCHDLGNATNALNTWLEKLARGEITLPACDVCGAPSAGGQVMADTVLCPDHAAKARQFVQELKERVAPPTNPADVAALMSLDEALHNPAVFAAGMEEITLNPTGRVLPKPSAN